MSRNPNDNGSVTCRITLILSILFINLVLLKPVKFDRLSEHIEYESISFFLFFKYCIIEFRCFEYVELSLVYFLS